MRGVASVGDDARRFSPDNEYVPLLERDGDDMECVVCVVDGVATDTRVDLEGVPGTVAAAAASYASTENDVPASGEPRLVA